MEKATKKQYIEKACPEEEINLSDPFRLAYLANRYPGLAADTILRKEIKGNLEKIVSEALIWVPQNPQKKVCQTFIEIIFNLFGMERKRIGFSDDEVEKTVQCIKETFQKWEKTEDGRYVLETAIKDTLQDMKKVTAGKSLVAKIAENIEQKLEKTNLSESLIKAIKEEIQGNIYYQMVDKGMSKFGNDSATGLRTVRHFDYLQVSSNPVIAAKAYGEFPELWDDFKKIIETNPEWQKNPDKYGDEIALHGTITSLLPNLLIFRPIALLSNFRDGMVSYQLNPFKAENAQESVKDAEKICSILKEILYQYDTWLGWDTEKYQGRPNIVFKVATSSPAAIDLTIALNEKGIGTNDTVTYSVSQEIELLIAEIEGMAKALKKGILPSQVYQTNMIGRTEDHLREVVAEDIVSELLRKKHIEELIKELHSEANGSLEEKIKTICSKKYLKSLTDERFLKVFLKEGYDKLLEKDIVFLEKAIQYSGIFVTRRVYQLFFTPENKEKWNTYLRKKYDLSKEQAEMILGRTDMLPASKRRAQDTYLVLGAHNVTNTEFPNHQSDVWQFSLEENFDLEKYRNSIMEKPDLDILEVLLRIEDFKKVFGLSSNLIGKLEEIGIKDDFSEITGMEPKDWSQYGAVMKTMTEFKNAYLDFKQKSIEFIKG